MHLIQDGQLVTLLQLKQGGVRGVSTYRTMNHRKWPNRLRRGNHNDLYGCNGIDDDDDLLDLHDDNADGTDDEAMITHPQLRLDDFEPDVEPVYFTNSGEDSPKHDGANITEQSLHRAPLDDELLTDLQHVELEDSEKRNCWDYAISGYAWFLSYFCLVPIAVAIILLVALTWSSFHYYPPPDFKSDATEGFETRGTYIRRAMSTLQRLRSSVLGKGDLVYAPDTELTLKQLGIDPALFGMLAGRRRKRRGVPRGGGEGDEWGIEGEGMEIGGEGWVMGSEGEEMKEKKWGMGGDGEEMAGDWWGMGEEKWGMKEHGWGVEEKKEWVEEQREDNNIEMDHAWEDLAMIEPLKHFRKAKRDVQGEEAQGEDEYEQEQQDGTTTEVLEGVSADQRISGGSHCTCEFSNCITHFPIFVFIPAPPKDDLFTAAAMRSICHFTESVIYPRAEEGHIYCPAFSMPNSISKLLEKKCEDINEQDMKQVKNVLETCGRYTYDERNATSSGQKIPYLCSRYIMPVVTSILINNANIGWLNLTTQKLGKLTSTAVYMSGYYNSELDFFYDKLEDNENEDENVKLTAVRFSSENVKWNLLGDYLLDDLIYFAVALGLVFVVMIFYLRSVVLMFATLFNVLCSYSTTYFLYYFVCRMKFFPYLNFLAGLVLIAVGADDMFIFYDCWEQARAVDPSRPIAKILDRTLRQAALSVFVTSLTTSSAFFANALSSITSIQCFAIFAGIAILTNLFYMLTFIPAVIALIEWVYRLYMKSTKFQALNAKVEKITQKLHSLSVLIFHHFFPYLIRKSWFVWIFLFLIQGLGACVVVFIYPRFQLPISQDFQLFPASNPIESWDLKYHKEFQSIQLKEADSFNRIRLFLVYGINADDPGNRFDPKDTGVHAPIDLDPSFNIGDPATQVYLYNSCHELLKQSLMPDDVKMTCQLDAILELMKSYCSNPLVKLSPAGKCCPDTISIPLDADIMRTCSAAYQLLLYNNSRNNDSLNLGTIMGDFILNKTTNEVKGYAIYIQSNLIPSYSYETMAEYNDMIRGFLSKQLSTGPLGVQSGFVAYTDWFWFYDLQHALATGTFYSIGLSLGVAFIVMWMTSQNLLITVYAMLTICLAICSTIAILVFLGWHLNIIESLIISLAVGLSIDFTIHFGVAYRLSKSATSKERTEEGFRTVGSAVAMGALTTFLAGSAVMPARVLIYTKLGIFLMLVMTFSWLYSNLFFQSVCHIIGPSEQCYKSCRSCSCCRRTGSRDRQHDMVDLTRHSQLV